MGVRNGCFFEVFACGKRSRRKTSDIDKTLAGAMQNALRSCRALTENVEKSIRKRFQLRWAMRTALTGTLGVVPKALGASLGRPGDVFGRLLAALGAPVAPQDRLWGGIWVSKSHLERVRTRPSNDFGRPKRPKIDFSSIWDGFSSIFERFFVDFRSCRVRRRHKNRISKKSRAILSARLGSCVVQSLRTARTSFDMTFRRCLFSLFPLRTHKPT